MNIPKKYKSKKYLDDVISCSVAVAVTTGLVVAAPMLVVTLGGGTSGAAIMVGLAKIGGVFGGGALTGIGALVATPPIGGTIAFTSSKGVGAIMRNV